MELGEKLHETKIWPANAEMHTKVPDEIWYENAFIYLFAISWGFSKIQYNYDWHIFDSLNLLLSSGNWEHHTWFEENSVQALLVLLR